MVMNVSSGDDDPSLEELCEVTRNVEAMSGVFGGASPNGWIYQNHFNAVHRLLELGVIEKANGKLYITQTGKCWRKLTCL